MRKLVAPVLIALSAAGCAEGDKSNASAPPADGRPVIAITVDDKGYTPSEVKAKGGAPVRLVFTRTTDDGCGQQLVFKEQKIQKDLPLKEPVAVDITMPASGRVTFACGMDMYRGAVVVE